MKKMMILVMMMTIAISAAAMPYNTARNEALYLSDKMAYELGLTATQYEAVYEINLDYLLNVDTRADVFGFWWDVRNRDLRYVLSTWQYDRFMASEWFYRPIIWGTGGWTFSIYTRYGVGRMFFDRPAVFVTFKGGHSHRGGSFYAGHHFDKPNPPKGHGNHNNNHNNNGNHNNNHNNTGNWNHGGNHNGNPNGNGNHSNGNWNHGGNHNGTPNGNGNHNPSMNNGNRPMTGNGNPSMGGGFGNSHRSGSANTPSRTFGTRPSGNVASHGNGGTSAAHGTFGGRR
ncbi:MAG: hypothetical protein IKH80_09625 [Bacteroidaceae bacterium]|nr:hypothetical protein [Bacteroidaceae bacterium]